LRDGKPVHLARRWVDDYQQYAMSRASSHVGRKRLCLAAIVTMIAAAWFWSRPPRDPVHDGVRLSHLVIPLPMQKGFAFPAPEQVLAFGPAGIEWLSYVAEHGRHPPDTTRPLPLSQAPDWLRRFLPQKWGGLSGASLVDERAFALMVLRRLGPQAAPAIPVLASCLEHDDSPLRAQAAAAALFAIGPAASPAIRHVLISGSPSARLTVLSEFQQSLNSKQRPVDADIVLAAEVLSQISHSPDPKVRELAVKFMGQCRKELGDSTLFDSVIPDLTQLLDDKAVQLLALYMIPNFGTKAAAAVPRVIGFMDDPDPAIRRRAMESVRRLDIEGQRSAPRLRAMLQDSDSRCRIVAMSILQAFGIAPEENQQSTR
jgi:hypothetical protein